MFHAIAQTLSVVLFISLRRIWCLPEKFKTSQKLNRHFFLLVELFFLLHSSKHNELEKKQNKLHSSHTQLSLSNTHFQNGVNKWMRKAFMIWSTKKAELLSNSLTHGKDAVRQQNLEETIEKCENNSSFENKIGADVERKNGFLRENGEMKITEQNMAILKLNELGEGGCTYCRTLCAGEAAEAVDDTVGLFSWACDSSHFPSSSSS